MTKYYLLFFSLLQLTVYSQSIPIALYHDRDPEIQKSTKVAEIKSDITYFRNDGMESSKTLSLFNEKNKLTSELRYNEAGVLSARLTVIYDSAMAKKLSQKYETWNPVVGHSVEISEYTYDENNNLIQTINKNQSGNTFRITTIENNKNGDPVKIIVKNPKQEIIGMESAKYNYETNTAVVSILDESGNVVNSYPMRINFSERKFDDLTYNENGDLIETPFGTYTYKYDKQKNWTKRDQFKIHNGEKLKIETIKRKLKYRK